MDFFAVSTVHFRVLYVWFVLAHGRRHVMHFNVTANPTAQWVVQQLREAFPEASAPTYLVGGLHHRYVWHGAGWIPVQRDRGQRSWRGRLLGTHSAVGMALSTKCARRPSRRSLRYVLLRSSVAFASLFAASRAASEAFLHASRSAPVNASHFSTATLWSASALAIATS